MSRRRTAVSRLRFEASGKSPEPEQPEDKMQSEIGHQNSQWRCRQCGTLLGVATGDEVEVRYKTAVYRVRGAGCPEECEHAKPGGLVAASHVSARLSR